MIEIKHSISGRVLHTVEGDTLAGADLRDVYLWKDRENNEQAT